MLTLNQLVLQLCMLMGACLPAAVQILLVFRPWGRQHGGSVCVAADRRIKVVSVQVVTYAQLLLYNTVSLTVQKIQRNQSFSKSMLCATWTHLLCVIV